MEIATIVAALLKLTIEGYAAYMKTQGLTDAEIDAVFQQVRADVIAHDPNDLPTN